MKKILMFVIMFVVFIACDNTTKIKVDDKGNPVDQTGEEGFDCYPNDTCNKGLVCLDDYCQKIKTDPVVDNDTTEPDPDHLVDDNDTTEPDPDEGTYNGCVLPEMGIDLKFWECINKKWVMIVPYDAMIEAQVPPNDVNYRCGYHQFRHQMNIQENINFRRHTRLLGFNDIHRFINQESCSHITTECYFDRKLEEFRGNCRCTIGGWTNPDTALPDLFLEKSSKTVWRHYILVEIDKVVVGAKPQTRYYLMRYSRYAEGGSELIFNTVEKKSTSYQGYHICTWEEDFIHY